MAATFLRAMIQSRKAKEPVSKHKPAPHGMPRNGSGCLRRVLSWHFPPTKDGPSPNAAGCAAPFLTNRLTNGIAHATIPLETEVFGMLRRVVVLIAVLVNLIPGAVAQAQSPPSCRFILGFAALAAAIPQQVGTCLDNQAFAANGDALQHTTSGLLVWRKADNWTAFTDGYHSWLNGPNGIQERLNTQRFSWEVASGWQESSGCIKTPFPVGRSGQMLAGSCSIPLTDPNGPLDLSMLLFAAGDTPVAFLGTLNNSMVTLRLLARLTWLSTPLPGATMGPPPPQAVLTQAGNGGLPPSFVFTLRSATANQSVVEVRPLSPWYAPYDLEVVILPTVAGWRVDDVRCTGQRTPSILTATSSNLSCGPA